MSRLVDLGLLKRFWPFVRPHWRLLAVSLCLLPVLAGVQLVTPWLVKLVVDEHIAPGKLEGLGRLAGLYFGAVMLTFCAMAINHYVMQLTGQQVTFAIRTALFAKVQQLDAAYFDKTPTGRVITRLTGDVEAIGELFASGLVSILSDLLLLIGIVVVMLVLSWKLALVTFCLIPPLVLLAWWLRLRLGQAYREIRLRLSTLNSYLAEALSGIQIVHLFRQEQRCADEFGERSERLLSTELLSVRWDSTLSALVELASSLSVGVLIWYGGGLASQGALTFGVLVAFIQYTQKFYNPIKDLSAKYTVLQSALAAGEKVIDLLDEPVGITAPPDPLPLQAPRGEICFEHVDFAYNSSEPVLRDVSFSVAPGERIGIVGPTGSGKTTLVKLLTRHYDATAGRILLDGTPIERFDPVELRRAIGLVPQDVYLFADTVTANIGLDNPKISIEAIRRAADVVEATAFIEALPNGFDTRLADRGGNLSVGQRQLLAFARALAHDPPVLVLDEATSAIDHETESIVQRGLERLLEGRTAILIAHRLATLRSVDRILVVHHGRIAESGTHEQLLAREGIYWRLHQLQFSTSY